MSKYYDVLYLSDQVVVITEKGLTVARISLEDPEEYDEWRVEVISDKAEFYVVSQEEAIRFALDLLEQIKNEKLEPTPSTVLPPDIAECDKCDRLFYRPDTDVKCPYCRITRLEGQLLSAYGWCKSCYASIRDRYELKEQD